MPRRKTTNIRFRCTEEFKQRLEDVADALEIDPSKLCRRILIKGIKYREGQIEKLGAEKCRENLDDDD